MTTTNLEKSIQFIESALRDYLAQFELETDFSFSVQDSKRAHNEYRMLTNSLLSKLSEADLAANEISALVIKSDICMSVGDISHYSKRLDKYLEWKKSVYEFFQTNDGLFKNREKDFSYAVFISSARLFLIKTTDFKNFLSAK